MFTYYSMIITILQYSQRISNFGNQIHPLLSFNCYKISKRGREDKISIAIVQLNAFPRKQSSIMCCPSRQFIYLSYNFATVSTNLSINKTKYILF